MWILQYIRPNRQSHPDAASFAEAIHQRLQFDEDEFYRRRDRIGQAWVWGCDIPPLSDWARELEELVRVMKG